MIYNLGGELLALGLFPSLVNRCFEPWPVPAAVLLVKWSKVSVYILCLCLRFYEIGTNLCISDFLERISELEEQNKRMGDEFNAQRARLKEMFMHKECKYIWVKYKRNMFLFPIYTFLSWTSKTVARKCWAFQGAGRR